MYWYVRRRLYDAGPFTAEMVADMLGRGELTVADLVRREDGREWHRFHNQVGFELHLRQGRVGQGSTTPRSFAYATACLQAFLGTTLGIAAMAILVMEDMPVVLGAIAGLVLTTCGFLGGLRGRAPLPVRRLAMRCSSVRVNVLLCVVHALCIMACLLFAAVVGFHSVETWRLHLR